MKPYYALILLVVILVSGCDAKQPSPTQGGRAGSSLGPIQVIPAPLDKEGTALPLYDYSNGFDLMSSRSDYTRPQPVESPVFKNHPSFLDPQIASEFPLHLDFDGCNHRTSLGWYYCPDTTEIGQLGCTDVDILPVELYEIDPHSPLRAICIVKLTPNQEMRTEPVILSNGCMAVYGIQYLASYNGTLVVVNNVDLLRDVFAPVDSVQEALLYALAATGSETLSGLEVEPGRFYLANEIEDTYVQPVRDGYKVHTFHTGYCSCNPHLTEAFDMTVTANGKLTIDRITPMFDDGTEMGACVD